MPPKRKKGISNQVGRRKKARKDEDSDVDCAVVKKEPDSPLKISCVKTLMLKSKKGILDATDLAIKKMISCQECTKKFRFNKSYLNHLKEEHSKLPGSVECDRCPVRCPDLEKLQQHIANIHERQTFECEYCKKPFVRQAHVQRHMAQKGCDGNDILIYPCEICNVLFTRKDNLMVHLRLQHIIRKKFTCKQCQFSTASFSRLITHVQKSHSDKPTQYECDHCGKVTSSRAAICKHLEIHGDKKYACDVCGYSTFTVEVMRRHVLTHVTNKPYKCELCSDSFIQRSQLQRHAARHGYFSDAASSYKCKICAKNFNTEKRFLTHKKTHVKQYLCPSADVEDRDKDTLDSNLKEENVSRPIKCEVCQKSFRLETDMRRHVVSHTLERPRRCMYCVSPRAYVRGEQLVKHVRRIHSNVFREHLAHVRNVLGSKSLMERVTKSEITSILNVLDAEADRILEGYGEGVLYGGMQDADTAAPEPPSPKNVDGPLMSEEELMQNLSKLLVQLIDLELLECFGWPNESVDMVLEKVIEHCGAKPAEREKWTRVQRLRENTKRLFLYVIEDSNIARMLDSHTIDQIVKHILTQVTDDDWDKKKITL